jgi:hypothetical protein
MQYKAFVCHSRFREWLCQGIFVGSEELHIVLIPDSRRWSEAELTGIRDRIKSTLRLSPIGKKRYEG